MLSFKTELANAFHETQSFKWNSTTGFTLASGLNSPYYVDCRSLLAHPGPRRLVANLAYEALQPIDFDCLGGLEIGAISIATSISDFAFATQPSKTWRTFVVRKQVKDHGLGKLIEGSFRPGNRAVIVDDVLTSGGSLLKAVAASRSAGLVVTHALVIVDRKEQDGRRNVEAEGLTLVSLLTIEDLTGVQPTRS
jgi:orotate phosphoribosyltransferase